MNPQNRKLALRMRGKDVQRLQAALGQIGFSIADREGYFGKTTRQAVLTFQEQQGLEPTGVVDEETAELIDRGVEGQQPTLSKPFVVKGQVVHADGKPFAGGLVRAYDKDLRSEELLGETATDKGGRYEILYSAEQFRRAEKRRADLIVRAYNREGRELAHSPILFNAEPEETVDLVVGGEVYRGPSEVEQLVEELTPLVQGLSFAELTEDEQHQDITFLSGETGQDPQHIAFLIKAHRLMQKTELAAEVYYGLFRGGLPTQLPALLAQSPAVQRRALVRAVDDNIIPARFAQEIDAVLERLRQWIARQALEAPAETDKATLAQLIGTVLPRREQRAAFLSAYVDHSGPVAEFWEGLRARPEFKDRVKDLQFSLQLGALTKSHLPLVRELQQAKQAGKLRVGGRELPLHAIQDLAQLDESDWLHLVDREAGDRAIGVPPGVPGKDDQEKARTYARAMAHMVEDAFPTAFVTHRLEVDDLPGKDDLLTFFRANPEFNLRSTRLDSFVRGKPEALSGVADVEGTKSRVKAMQRLYKLAPRYAQTSALMKDGLDSAYRIARMSPNLFVAQYGAAVGGRAQAKRIHERAGQVQATALNLLAAYGPMFGRVGMHAVPDEPVLEVEGVAEWSTLFGSIELCQCDHCRSVYSPAAYLVDLLHFLSDRKLTDHVERDDAGRIIRVFYRRRPYGTGGVTEIIGHAASVKDALFGRRPDLGQIELTCENTNTPLPYVDLVNEVLENAVAPPPAFVPFPLDAALEADLNDRTLSDALCDAFDPHLSDEAVITVGGQGQPYTTDEPWWTIDELAFTYTVRKEDGELSVVSRSLQTKGSAAERAANPQYVNADAYEELRRRVYPWSLPFDLWAEEARAYLAHLGVPRHQIIEILSPGERPAILRDVALACEYLGLTSAEAGIISGATTSQPGADAPGIWNLWGFETQTLSAATSIPDPADSTRRIRGGDWLDVIRDRVDVFLQQSGLTYKELLDLLDTYYINPITGGARAVQIASNDPDCPATCETAKLSLQGLDESMAVRIVRFVRLWRKLDWTMRDLDRAITTFSPADLNQTFITQLSHVQRLHDDLCVPVLHLLAWWAPIDTALYVDHEASGGPPVRSLYAQLFRNKAGINPPDPAFAEDPADLSGPLLEHAATITAALGVSAADLELLFNDGNVFPRIPDPADPTSTIPDDRLTLDHLSRLFRHVTLAKALRLPVREYLSALQLTGANPFIDTADSVLFVEQVGRARRSGFTFPELDYLLRHSFTPASGLAPNEEAAVVVLDEIRGGLLKIGAETAFSEDPADPSGVTTDPNGDLTRQKLALLNWDSAVIEQVVAALNDATRYEAPLAALPVGIVFPPEVQNRLSYDSTAHRLRFSGVMTADQRALLVDLPEADEGFESAVNVLFDAPRNLLARNMRTFSVQSFSEPLAALPEGVEFPNALKGKTYHDAGAGELHFIGAMAEQERDDLLALSADPADPNHAPYQAAVNALFAQPDALVPEPGDTFLTTSGPDNDIAVLFDGLTTPGARFLHLLKKLLPYLRRRLSERLVEQKLAEALNLETRMTEALLARWVASPADPDPGLKRRALAEFLDPAFAESNPNVKLIPQAFPAQFKTFARLHKIATLASRFKLTPRQLAWLFDYGPGVGWLDLNTLPVDPQQPAASFGGWLRLADLFELRDGLSMGEQVLARILSLARRAGVSRDELLQQLGEHTQWNRGDLEFLVGEEGFDLTLPDAFRDERELMRLQACFTLLKRLGIAARQCCDLATGDVTLEKARGVIQAVRAKYDEDQWLSLAQPLRDVLREKQRAALVAHLVAHFRLPGDGNIRDANDLYAHFLIDVEMSPCMMTSRIKQAISSTQLFVQRCLMNLEPEVTASAEVDVNWRQWKWMKNYRVWEANRKVFLYPENWIEPELRDGKSPFFKELESELLQSDLTLETAETAFLHYLEKLDQVADLEIVGMYHQLEKDQHQNVAVDILHVFGRTKNGDPRVYFYRQRVDSTFWTAWERVDLDIQGEHLIPVVWNRRLYLFWPIFALKPGQYEVRMPAQDDAFEQPETYWEIKLAWSERKQDKWTTKKVSSACLEFDKRYSDTPVLRWVGYPTRLLFDLRSVRLEDETAFVFSSHVDDDNRLSIISIISHPLVLAPSGLFILGEPNAFQFDGCNTEPRASQFWVSFLQSVTGTEFDRMFLKEKAVGEHKLYLPAPTDTPALAQTPGRFLLLPHHDGSSIAEHPFFYMDDTRTFFVFSRWEEIRARRMPALMVAADLAFIPYLPESYYEELGPEIDSIGPLTNPGDPIAYEPSFPARSELGLATAGGVSRGGGVTPPAGVGAAGPAGMGAGPLHRVTPSPGGLPSRTMMLSAYRRSSDSALMRSLRAAHARAAPGASVARLASGAATLAGRAGAGAVAFAFSLDRYAGILGDDVPGLSFFANHFTAAGYRFQTFYHPYVSAFVRELNRDGVDGLLQRKVQTEPHLFLPRRSLTDPPPEPLDFEETYKPGRPDISQPIVVGLYPEEEVDFKHEGAYSLYNWELFFHAPLMIADRLSVNQRFKEAQKWFHYIFDPTDTSSDAAPARYWRTKTLHETSPENYQKERIQHILGLLAKGGDPEQRASLSPPEQEELEGLENSVQEWRKHPFQPHLIARLRTTAYQKAVVMKYIDNLIAWGDQLFRRDTIESINEATQLYVLAAEILGRRREKVPPRATPQVQTYNSLERTLGVFGNALVQIEEFISPSAGEGVAYPGDHPPLTLPATLYFCIPKNDKLLGYWDTVADRLFKIRHCMTIEGVVRQLPLFEPPIEPGLLVRAAAAGVDLSSVLSDVSSALPHYRFNVWAQKAAELCAELKSLGSALLSALEKRDAEELALIRARHETTLLETVEQVKIQQYEEAEQNQEALRKSRDVAVARYLHYRKLLGVQSPQAPAEGQPISDYSASQQVIVDEEEGIQMISQEKEELEKLRESHLREKMASGTELAASVAYAFPNVNIEPFGVGMTLGGSNVGAVMTAIANQLRAVARGYSYEGSRAARLGQYLLRAHDWMLQSNLAAKEITQLDKQISVAEIRKQIAEQELQNHRTQTDNAHKVEAFMRDKYTNQELYAWMVGQVASVYFETYQLAYDAAKRAEQAYRFELGLRDSSFIQFGYWDSLKKGLLVGERLHYDLKRMEIAYLDQNKREYEITKHVSLAQLDPVALVMLKETGECFVHLPEAIFDLDYPGHYMRRIKSVSLTIPCVIGPYTSINCTLTLLGNRVRKDTTGESYPYTGMEDPRFQHNLGAIQSIATSSAQSDSGLFELNFRDERYLPFEGAGAISQWRLELPNEFRQFDYDTITDVILHVRYTARDGGSALKNAATAALQDAINTMALGAERTGLIRLFSARHEFPNEWHSFLTLADENGDHVQAFSLSKNRFPFLFQGRTLTVTGVDLVAVPKPGVERPELILELITPDDQVVDLHDAAAVGRLVHKTAAVHDVEVKGAEDNQADWVFKVLQANTPSLAGLEDILVLCHYTISG